jgi:hypothetical protein
MPKNLVIFCGAGFSAVAGLPVMSNFTDRLRDSSYLSTIDRMWDFDQIQLLCDGLGAFIGGSARNVENLASFLSMMAITQPNRTFPGSFEVNTPAKARDFVIEGMRQLISADVAGDAFAAFTNGAYKIFDLKDVELTFVTTNYDLLIEAMAARMQKHVTPTNDILDGCKQYRDHPIYQGPNVAGVRVFKLHGSIN